MARKPLTKSEKFLMALCGLVICIFVIYRLVVVPAKNRQEEMDQKIQKEFVKLKKNTLVLKTAQQVDQNYAGLNTLLGQKGGDDTERSAMLASIQQVAKETDVNIANVQPQRVLNKDVYKEFSVLLLIDATWPSTMEFLHRLQDTPNFFDVNEVTLERNSLTANTIRSRILLSRVRLPESKE